MSVYMLTTRKGGTREAMMAATRELKATAEKHGAESVTLSQVVAGPDAGQWVIRDLVRQLAGIRQGGGSRYDRQGCARMPSRDWMLAISEVVSRRVVAGVDL